jgi:hypothetical protein
VAVPMMRVVDGGADENANAPDFSDFWLLYPRRVAKKEAAKAWDKLTPTAQVAAVTGLVAWRRVWAKRDLDYVPHAASWLNGERWEDEIPPDAAAQHASHFAVDAAEEVAPRTTMPDHVRALLAKLRGKG